MVLVVCVHSSSYVAYCYIPRKFRFSLEKNHHFQIRRKSSLQCDTFPFPVVSERPQLDYHNREIHSFHTVPGTLQTLSCHLCLSHLIQRHNIILQCWVNKLIHNILTTRNYSLRGRNLTFVSTLKINVKCFITNKQSFPCSMVIQNIYITDLMVFESPAMHDQTVKHF